jgi:hypothetical protein
MLKSGFRFWANLSLGVQASDASDQMMVGYLLEQFCEGAPVGATMMIRRPSSVESNKCFPRFQGNHRWILDHGTLLMRRSSVFQLMARR